MHCKNCGKSIEKDSNFCKYCGKSIDRKTNNTPIIILGVFICIIMVLMLSITAGKTFAKIVDNVNKKTVELDKNYDEYFNDWYNYSDRYRDNNEDSYSDRYYNDKNNDYADYTKFFENIDIQKFLELKSKEEISIIYIGKDNCLPCYQQSVYLYSIARRYNIKINYINISDISDEDYQKLIESDDFFKTEWSTPLILLVKNNQIIEEEDDLQTISELLELFREYELINN